MDTITKTAQPHATDRLIQALSTLGALLDRTINEVKTLDSDFQNRLLQAVHDTETSLQQQASEHLQHALSETEERLHAEMAATIENVRQELTADRDKAAAEQLRVAVREAEERVRIEIAAERDKSAAEELRQAVRETEERVRAEMNAAIENLRAELNAEREKLNTALDHSAQATLQWESERKSLQDELEKTRQTLAEAETKLKEAAAAPPPPAPAPSSSNHKALDAEIERIEGQIAKITALIDDPVTELSTVIRKNVERAELDSYLRGIRFALK